MNIAVVSPSALRTPPIDYGGVEKIAYLIVRGLEDRGHRVSLIAKEGSYTPKHGILIEMDNEINSAKWYMQLVCRWNAQHVDCIIDLTHDKHLAVDLGGDYPILQVHQVMSLMGNGRCPVLISEGQRQEKYPGLKCEIVNQCIDLDELPINDEERGDFLLYMGQHIIEKRVNWACEVATRTHTPLYTKGTWWGQKECHDLLRKYENDYPAWVHLGESIGGEDKLRMLQTAKALIHLPGALGWSEAGAIVVLEALATGTPVIGSRNGCIPQYIEGKNNGFICDTIEDAVAAVDKVADIKPIDCRNSVLRYDFRTIARQWESLCQRVANGERW